MIKVYRSEVEIVELSSRNAEHITAIMGADEVRVSVVVDSILEVKEGDCILHDGVKYSLNREPEYTINSEVEYAYDLVFEHPSYLFIDKLFCHKTTKSSIFTLTGKLSDFVDILIWNINTSFQNPEGVDTDWTVGEVAETDYQNITFTDATCREVLNILSDEFDVEFWFENKELNFSESIETLTDFVFEQGEGKGLYTLGQQNVDKEDTITRLYVRGGNQNVPNESADEEGYLKLPENYLENFSEHSKVVEKKVRLTEEFPHFIGTASAVSGDHNEEITCPQIDFDLEEIAIGDNARINFLSGDLTGLSFKFDWNNSAKKITLIEQEDEMALPDSEGDKPIVPSALKKADVGDTFNFTGVLMPQSYVDASISRLRTKGTKRLNFFSKKRVKFSLDIDFRWMRGKPRLKVGDLVVISIPERTFSKVIRVTGLEEHLHTGAVTATVSNYLEESWEKYIESRVEAVKNQIESTQTDPKISDGTIYRDRGVWSLATAENKPYLRNVKTNDTAWHNGNKWLCLTNGTLDEPSFISDDWLMIEGRSDIRMEFDSSHGYSFFHGAVETKITPIVFIGNINVSVDIAPENWRWERVSGDSVSDSIWNAQHTQTRVLDLSNEDMGVLWGRTNPVKFICTATYPKSQNEISSYIEI